MSVSKLDFIKGLHSRVDISLKTLSDLYNLPTYLRKWKLIVGIHSDDNPVNNGNYQLIRGLNSNNIQDNLNWTRLSSSDGDTGSVNYQTPLPPNPYSVNIGDSWTELSTGSHFRLVEIAYSSIFDDSFDDSFTDISKRYWIETTSPGCFEEGLKTFTNSFDYTFDRDEDIYDEEFNVWDNTFDVPFGPNPRYFDITFNITFN